MQHPSPTFAHFPWELVSFGCLISITSVLNYFQIVNFLFIFWWTLKQVASNSQLCFIFVTMYNRHLFTIILKIHIFTIFCGTMMFFIHLFRFDIKIVQQFLFFLLLQYSIKISLHIDSSINSYHFCQRHFIIAIK